MRFFTISSDSEGRRRRPPLRRSRPANRFPPIPDPRFGAKNPRYGAGLSRQNERICCRTASGSPQTSESQMVRTRRPVASMRRNLGVVSNAIEQGRVEALGEDFDDVGGSGNLEIDPANPFLVADVNLAP